MHVDSVGVVLKRFTFRNLSKRRSKQRRRSREKRQDGNRAEGLALLFIGAIVVLLSMRCVVAVATNGSRRLHCSAHHSSETGK